MQAPLKLKTQNDYLFTEVSVDLPPDIGGQARLLGEVHDLMRESRSTGKVVVQYCNGGVIGVNLEQRSRIREGISSRVRQLVGIATKEINGHH